MVGAPQPATRDVARILTRCISGQQQSSVTSADVTDLLPEHSNRNQAGSMGHASCHLEQDACRWRHMNVNGLYRSAGGKKVRRRQRCLDRLFPSTLMRGSGPRQCSTSAIVSRRRGNIFCATWFYFFTWSGVPNRRNRHCSLCECIEECIRVVRSNVSRRGSTKCRRVLKWPDGCEAAASSHAQRQMRTP